MSELDQVAHDQRESDRLIRAQIDPLLSGLSQLGRLELIARLMGETMTGVGASLLRGIDAGTRELPPGVAGVLEQKRDGAAPEAGEDGDDAAPITSQTREDTTNGTT